jgi:hypothetical protein
MLYCLCAFLSVLQSDCRAKQPVQNGGCGFKTVKLQPRSPFNNEERLDSFSPREVPRALIPLAEDHNSTLSHYYALRQHNEAGYSSNSGNDDLGPILKHKFNAVERELGTMNLRQPAASLRVSKQRRSFFVEKILTRSLLILYTREFARRHCRALRGRNFQ